MISGVTTLNYLDIQFWRTRKSLEGLSVRSVFFNIFQSLIVLLYVFDNEANTMVRISVCIGIVIELWKVPKILNFQVKYFLFLSLIKIILFKRLPNQTWFGFIPKYKYVYKQSYTETSTSEYDRVRSIDLLFKAYSISFCLDGF
jgi:hypothetical protein